MSNSSLTKTPGDAVSPHGGKYLTFSLGGEEYGLQIGKVREIIGYLHVTAVPRTPPFVEGVINLRGQIIPVLDLRVRFAMETAARTRQTCIIVVETRRDGRGLSIGLIVDRVLEVLEIAGKDIDEPPALGSAVATDFILGMGKSGNAVKILLDVDRVVATGDGYGETTAISTDTKAA